MQRTARYHVLGANTVAPREIWIVCHGYAQLARYFLRSFEPLDDGTRIIAAPEALNRYYFETAPGVHGADARVAATWMTREDREHEIDDYVAYLDVLAAKLLRDVPADASPRLVALGFSQGAATVSRWVARSTTRVHEVVLWGSGIAHELQPGPGLFRGAGLSVVVGNADEHVSDIHVHAEDRRLREAGMQYRLLRYAGGHRVEAAGLLSLAGQIGS